MLSAGFAGAQITQSLFLGLIAVFILVNVANLRHLFYIQAVPLLWPNQQLWRILLWQVCFSNLLITICIVDLLRT